MGEGGEMGGVGECRRRRGGKGGGERGEGVGVEKITVQGNGMLKNKTIGIKCIKILQPSFTDVPRSLKAEKETPSEQ